MSSAAGTVRMSISRRPANGRCTIGSADSPRSARTGAARAEPVWRDSEGSALRARRHALRDSPGSEARTHRKCTPCVVASAQQGDEDRRRRAPGSPKPTLSRTLSVRGRFHSFRCAGSPRPSERFVAPPPSHGSGDTPPRGRHRESGVELQTARRTSGIGTRRRAFFRPSC
jgi:hypothetical protein